MSDCLTTFQMIVPPVVAVAGIFAGYSFGKATAEMESELNE